MWKNKSAANCSLLFPGSRFHINVVVKVSPWLKACGSMSTIHHFALLNPIKCLGISLVLRVTLLLHCIAFMYRAFQPEGLIN